MKKGFLLFAGHNYYPDGGWQDMRACCESVDGAMTTGRRKAQKEYWDWYHIVDIITGKIVLQGQFAWENRSGRRKLVRMTEERPE